MKVLVRRSFHTCSLYALEAKDKFVGSFVSFDSHIVILKITCKQAIRKPTLLYIMELNCRDVGVDCDFKVIGASSENELMQLAAIHAKMAHNIDPLPAELVEKVKQGMKH
jgi:predicted small metal-binding protein